MGDPTTLQTGTGRNQTTVWGSRFDLEVGTSLATLTGSAEKDLRVRRGPAEAPVLDSDQTRLVIDLNTGTLEDWEQMRFILRGGQGR